ARCEERDDVARDVADVDGDAEGVLVRCEAERDMGSVVWDALRRELHVADTERASHRVRAQIERTRHAREIDAAMDPDGRAEDDRKALQLREMVAVVVRR